jgi:hypothetical protein
LKVHTTNVSTGKDARSAQSCVCTNPHPSLSACCHGFFGVDDYSQPDIHFEMNV